MSEAQRARAARAESGRLDREGVYSRSGLGSRFRFGQRMRFRFGQRMRFRFRQL